MHEKHLCLTPEFSVYSFVLIDERVKMECKTRTLFHACSLVDYFFMTSAFNLFGFNSPQLAAGLFIVVRREKWFWHPMLDVQRIQHGAIDMITIESCENRSS